MTDLPTGWRKLKGPRPTYRRQDGYKVRLDNPASWGVRRPGESVPFQRGFREPENAMAWVDAECPVEGECS